MPSDDRELAMCLWGSIVAGAAVFYLGAGFIGSLVLGVFVLLCTMAGLGSGLLMRLSFALALLAFAVAFGLPEPALWPALLRPSPVAVG